MDNHLVLPTSTVFPADQPAEPPSPQVTDRLEHFQVISEGWLRAAFEYAPVVLALLLLADWLFGYGNYTRDLFLLTGALCILIELLLLRYLFAQVPDALRSLWTRGMICSAGPVTSEAHFLNYLNQFEAALNRRQAWAVGGLVALIGIALTYPVRVVLSGQHLDMTSAQLQNYYFLARPIYLYILLGLLLGVLVWRVVGIGTFINWLGMHFEIRILPNHPDNCAGLQPLGSLCLTIALLLLVPAIYFALWASLESLFYNNPAFGVYQLYWSPAFRQILAILIPIAVVAFFLPVYNIHNQMVRRKHAIQAELDTLSLQMDAILLDLRTRAMTLTSQQGDEKLEMLKFLQKVYDENSSIPTWPFDWKLLLRFSSAQAVPVLTLIGTSKPVTDLISSLLNSSAK